MERALFFLLALAVCLSACTSAPESEAGGEVMDATVENAVPAEESASSAAPVAGGAIWGDNCQADSGHAWYTVNPVGDENGVRQVQLLRLDYNTGKQDCLCTIDASPQQVGEPLDRAALARDFTEAVSAELVPRAIRALELTGYRKLAAAGGVAAEILKALVETD